MCKKCMFKDLFLNGEDMTDDQYARIRDLRKQEELNLSTAIACIEKYGIDYVKAHLAVVKAKNALYKAYDKLYEEQRKAEANQLLDRDNTQSQV
ncbi:hypothetical protein ACTUM7_01290 [Basfia succiniciproducens]|uniref:hypothetical protein n=1 Tax=Basfia succiniciproducens TaxID=653940 RepID=UPI003FCD7654